MIAAVLQSSTGYGFSIIGTPFLLLLYPVHTAIQINIILSICLSAVMIVKIRRGIDKPLLLQLIKGSLGGLLSGIFIYLFLHIQIVKMLVGVLTIVVTVLLLLKSTIKRTRNKDLIVGGISGFLTTSIGVPGPPLLVYFSGTRMDKVTLRSTTLAYYLFAYSASLMMQITFGGTNKEIWIHSLFAFPPLLFGIFLGQLLFKWISQEAFRVLTYILLMLTGTYLLVTSI